MLELCERTKEQHSILPMEFPFESWDFDKVFVFGSSFRIKPCTNWMIIYWLERFSKVLQSNGFAWKKYYCVIYGQIVFEIGVWMVSMSCFELPSVRPLILNVCIHHIHIISMKILWQQYCLLWVCFISLLLTSNLCFTSIYSIGTNLSTLGSFIQHWPTSVINCNGTSSMHILCLSFISKYCKVVFWNCTDGHILGIGHEHSLKFITNVYCIGRQTHHLWNKITTTK